MGRLPLAMSRRMGLLPTPDGFETDRTWRGVGVMARLQPGVTFEDVDARVPAWTTAFMAEDATLPADHTLRLRRPFEHRPPKEVAGLLALSGVVLLIACANLAGLLLARGMARAKEIAVRLTVGASRARIVRQLMLENAGLALAGGAAALALTVTFARALTRLDPPAQWRGLAAAQIDWRVFLFVLGLALATALLFGLGPALRASRPDVARSFGGGDAVVTGGNRRLFGMRNVLLMGQFAVSALFVLVSGVFVAGYLKASTAETGIGRPDAAAVRLDLWITRPAQDEVRGFMERFTRRASETGELHSVAFVSDLPAGGAMIGGVRSEGPGEGIGRTSGTVFAGPGALDALGIPLLQGREFNEHDRADTQRVALVSETAARLWWPGQSPIGKGVYLHGFGGWHEVVGVAGNTRVRLTRGVEELVYLHIGQHRAGLLIVGSSREGSGAAIAAIRRIAHEVDPDTPVGESKSVAQWLEGYVYGQWVYAAGFGSLAALAMLLACLGLYGALTFSVAQQTREFGVRMALGADGPAIRRMMLWQGLRVAGLGAAAGLYAAVLAIETIAKITQAVPGRGPLAFTLGPGVLIAVALVACYLPARRASRLDPVETLRAL
jgi:predicted permease